MTTLRRTLSLGGMASPASKYLLIIILHRKGLDQPVNAAGDTLPVISQQCRYSGSLDHAPAGAEPVRPNEICNLANSFLAPVLHFSYSCAWRTKSDETCDHIGGN
jgi:hypothetical protein